MVSAAGRKDFGCNEVTTVDEELERLCAIVTAVAKRELLPRFNATARTEKQDGSVVTEADLAAQAELKRALAASWPRYEFLGEEMDEAAQQRLLLGDCAGVWCVDPLDGTSNFAAGIPFFAVSVALLQRGAAVLGVVYDPVRRECFAARRGSGAWLNGVRLDTARPAATLRQAVALIDLKRLAPALAQRFASTPPYASQRSFGSVALDWCWIAAGRGDIYLHGKQKIWDYAAGSLVLAEAGGHAATLAGEPVFRAELAPRSAVAALDGALFEEWLAWLEVTR